MTAATQAERATAPCRWPTTESLGENLRDVRRAATTARYAAEDAIAETALNIRRHPFRSVGAAVVVGLIAGVLVGFGAGRFVRKRS